MTINCNPQASPTMNRSGYTIVFGGPDFKPEDFLRDSRLEPIITHRGDTLPSGDMADESWVEFADIHDGSYPLDAASEAIYFIESNTDEFHRLSSFPGVITRTLNFFGDAESCTMMLEPSSITLFHTLALEVSICPYF